MPARNPPKNGRPWTPERVRDRIRIGLIVSRLEKQALNELTEGGEKAKAQMTGLQLSAAQMLIDRCLPKAQAPIDLAVTGSITVIRRDPTQRPADYQRKGKASI